MPGQLSECPYCHRNEKGQDVSSIAESAPALDAQLQNELNQLAEADPVTQKNAADRLHQRGAAIVPLLINHLHEHAHQGGSGVARLLGRFRDRRSVNALIEALKMGDETTRISAVWALSQINDPAALDELLRECERTNPMVQSYLAHVLPSYQDERVLPALIKLSRHASRDVSFQAICSLGEVGNAKAIYPLRQLLGQKEPVLKTAAANALRRLGGPQRRVLPAKALFGVVVLILIGVGVWFGMVYR